MVCARPSPACRPILFFHGNGGEISGRAERLAFYQSQGFGVLFVSYRGYGASTGSISEQGFITDALTAYDFLRGSAALRRRDRAWWASRSAPALPCSLRRSAPWARWRSKRPITATVDVAADIYWWLPVRLLMKDQFRSRDFIGQVKVPLLIQHGDADRVIPVEQGRALFAMANEPKELVIIPGGGHDVIGEPAVWAREAGRSSVANGSSAQ